MAQVDQATTIEEMEDQVPQTTMEDVTQTPDLEASSTQSDSSPSSPPTPPPNSAITELQSAFPSILTATKSTDAISPQFDRRSIDWWYSNDLVYQPVKYPKAPPPPTWTSSFRLFDLPRELRDRIYFHYLSRRHSIRHDYRPYTGVRHDRTNPVDPVSLYLTNSQIYAESLSVFCRYNTLDVQLPSRSRATLTGTLRLFPDRAARLIQRVRMAYEVPFWPLEDDPFSARDATPTVFLQIIRDAYTLKSLFPMLRRFEAAWDDTALTLFEQEALTFDYRSHEQRVAIWKRWMRALLVSKRLVPPWWLQVQVLGVTLDADGGVDVLQASFDVAFAELRRELGRSLGEEKAIEESTRGWLEEVEKRERKKRRKEK